MKYAEINNDTIIKIHNVLPESWNNISNLYAIEEGELYDLSWSGNPDCRFYPVEETPRPEYNSLYEISDPTYTINDTNHKVVQSWTNTPVSNDRAWEVVRQRRNQKLYSTDWTQLPDSPLNEQQKNLAALYRQQLRDITEQSDPFNIVWPETTTNP